MDKARVQQKAVSIGFKTAMVYGHTLIGASALALLTTTVLPENFHSSPLDDYLKDQGLSPITSAVPGIRVYHRHNPLGAIHQTAHVTYHEKKEIGTSLPALDTFGILPFRIVQEIKNELMRTPTYAYVFKLQSTPCYVSPPDDKMTAADFIKDMAHLPSPPGVTFNVSAQTTKALRQFVMNHEVAHCEKKSSLTTLEREADADLKGLSQLKDQGYSPDTIKTATQIVMYARALSGVHQLGDDHSTAGALERGVAGGVEDLKTDVKSEEIVGSLAAVIFSAGHPYNAQELQKQPLPVKLFLPMAHIMGNPDIITDPDVRRTAARYIRGVQYFNRLSGGKLLEPVEKVLRTPAASAPGPS